MVSEIYSFLEQASPLLSLREEGEKESVSDQAFSAGKVEG
jgi:hypothetical protein